MIRKLIFILSCIIVLAACSTSITPFGQKKISIDELSACKTRSCILSKGITPIEVEKNKRGVIISEIYVVKQPRKATSKVLTDGVLDVTTVGIWEIAGVPTEGSLKNKKEYAIKVTYSNGEQIEQVELA